MAAEPANSTLSQTPEAIVGPLTDILQRTTGIIAANTPNDLHWDRLLIMLFFALAIFVIYNGHGAKTVDGRERKTGLLQFLLPRDIYTHVSARVDIWLWVLERVLRPLWVVSLIATVGPMTEQAVISSLEFVFGATPAFASAFIWMLLYSLFSLLCYGFMFFAIHYTMHKVPALWAIHKVHHSAEVLTPLTRTREHFLAGPIWATGSAFGFGVATGLFAYLFNGGITQATLFNASFFSFLFGLTGAFHHYHIEFRYPRWLSVWIQSPAMHHVHHSYLQKHWDKNMAAVTSVFDRLFGTLYIPEKNEHTPLGNRPGYPGPISLVLAEHHWPFPRLVPHAEPGRFSPGWRDAGASRRNAGALRPQKRMNTPKNRVLVLKLARRIS